MNIFLKNYINVLLFSAMSYCSTLFTMHTSQLFSEANIIGEVVLAYQQSLPLIACIPYDALAERKAVIIVDFLKQFYPVGFEISLEQEALETKLLEQKITTLIKTNSSLVMHMPGMAFKSPNSLRCISMKPDLADYLCLFTLNHS